MVIKRTYPDLPEDVRTLVAIKGWRPQVSTAFADQELSIIRRTILGPPRWKEFENVGERLPVSWRPSQVAAQLLGPNG
ncbi:hypothetical protein [Ferrimicrobium acidiphilum]|uniref:hypothetical protein n=1 Tax=Ferrimicrobium acidiphilum TaxID=121039 RepID=UPI003C6D59C9